MHRLGARFISSGLAKKYLLIANDVNPAGLTEGQAAEFKQLSGGDLKASEERYKSAKDESFQGQIVLTGTRSVEEGTRRRLYSTGLGRST